MKSLNDEQIKCKSLQKTNHNITKWPPFFPNNYLLVTVIRESLHTK
jgi:hypothetical protein